jgi:large subunit ribosomal protein L29
MNTNELREKSVDELSSLEQQLSDELFRLRMQHYTGQLDEPSKLKKTRRTIARVKTMLTERARGVA